MKLTSRAVFAHHTRHLLCAVLFLTFAPDAARADERCQQIAADEAVRPGQQDIHGAVIDVSSRRPGESRDPFLHH